VFAGPVGQEMFKLATEKMDITILTPIYLGTRQVNLREVRNVKTPADLKGVKLRMPGSKEWLFLGEALGATATPLAFREVHLALQTGNIDGQDKPLPPRPHPHAAALRRGVPRTQDRHHRRPGQPAAHGARGQVLRGHQAARDDEP